MDKEKRISELVQKLNEASKAYYIDAVEIMSNYEYDALYDELIALEKETGIILPNSPTQNVGYEVITKLEKVTHEKPALSLDKTKDRNILLKWLDDKEATISWKLDGLTVVATYNKGRLVDAVTRGNGTTGERILHNAKYFKGLPQKIDYMGKLIVRGEALMTFTEFERINSEIPNTEEKYKNPRNLASATVRLLDAKESSSREIRFYAFELVSAEPENYLNGNPKTFTLQFDWLTKLGFNVVDHKKVDKTTLFDSMDSFEKKLNDIEYPCDGLVLMYDDVEYGKSLGSTSHHDRAGIAFKWSDTTVETTIRKVEWSASRTGLLNPVAVFDSVKLEGTTVSRASVFNVSIVKKLQLGIGSKISVFKANMIIPQIAENLKPAGDVMIPDVCPVCGGKTVIKENNGIETLYCSNPDCLAKNVGKLNYFVSRDAMNIVGLSESTLEALVDLGIIHEFADIYNLNKPEYKELIINTERFGEKKYENLIKSIENSKTVTFSKLINAIGISEIGKSTAKDISLAMGNDPVNNFNKFIDEKRSFEEIEGIGPIVNLKIYKWMGNLKNRKAYNNLINVLTVTPDEIKGNSKDFVFGKTFVITGSLNHYKNREELKNIIETKGGKVSGSVSTKTNYLINNDTTSTSGKNKKAKELNIPIISEEKFIQLMS